MKTGSASNFKTRYLKHPIHQRWSQHWSYWVEHKSWPHTHPREAYFVERIHQELNEFNIHFSTKSAKKMWDTCQRALLLHPPIDEKARKAMKEFSVWISWSGRLPVNALIHRKESDSQNS